MDLITSVYLLVLTLGVVWVIVRAVKFGRVQRHREQEWHQIFSDEEFRDYLAELKKQTAEKSGPESAPPNPRDPSAHAL